MAEHIGRYDRICQISCRTGYIVSGHDHRGHGKTATINGIKGHFADKNGFNRAVQDAFEMISFFRTNIHPDVSFSLGIVWVPLLHGDISNSTVEVDLAIFSGTSGIRGRPLCGQAVAYLLERKMVSINQIIS